MSGKKSDIEIDRSTRYKNNILILKSLKENKNKEISSNHCQFHTDTFFDLEDVISGIKKTFEIIKVYSMKIYEIITKSFIIDLEHFSSKEFKLDKLEIEDKGYIFEIMIYRRGFRHEKGGTKCDYYLMITKYEVNKIEDNETFKKQIYEMKEEILGEVSHKIRSDAMAIIINELNNEVINEMKKEIKNRIFDEMNEIIISSINDLNDLINNEINNCFDGIYDKIKKKRFL